VSISVALAMLSLRACSGTQTEILEGLGFNLTDTPMIEMHQSFQQLIWSLNFPKQELELPMGNTLFIGKWLKSMVKFLDYFKTCPNPISPMFLYKRRRSKVKRRCKPKEGAGPYRQYSNLKLGELSMF